MKLLLTSAGITNAHIADALDELVGKPKTDVKIGFIPTAANAEGAIKFGLQSNSAGSIVVTPTIEVAAIEPGDPNIPGITDLKGLGLVNFEIEPHCEGGRYEVVGKYARSRENSVYAIDDQSAIKVEDSNVKVVSGGEWKKFN